METDWLMITFDKWLHLLKWEGLDHLPASLMGFPHSSGGIKETLVWFLGQKELLEKRKAAHFSIFGLPLWLSWYRICLQCGRPEFDPRIGKIPWRRERLPTPVFWPGESNGVFSPWGHKELDKTERLSLFEDEEKFKLMKMKLKLQNILDVALTEWHGGLCREGEKKRHQN